MAQNAAVYAGMQDVQWGERDPETGTEVFGGFALWEVPGAEKRRFRVTPWEQTCFLNYRDRKGWVLLARGFTGEEGDPRPLFAQAAKNFPERAAEFRGLISETTKNMEDRLAALQRKPPTREEVEQMKDERLGRIVGESAASGLGRVLTAALGRKNEKAPKPAEAEVSDEPTEAGDT